MTRSQKAILKCALGVVLMILTLWGGAYALTFLIPNASWTAIPFAVTASFLFATGLYYFLEAAC